ncbi:acyl carrier protein [Bacillus cereus group sp. N12]|uniref:acyl carrier protein n=1 Tax=Bacillus cereus group sp. N12 TaxID=2794586 RepID=UPI0018F78830|nr:acyl carrier protein [Bacillus cereus group sp. N12]MBJ8078357.1 acyl carrier protein [Bacillus cereus group sp. N12]
MKWIDTLFENLLPATTIEEIKLEFDSVKDTPLTQLGLDSLSIMGLVMRLEDEFDFSIDYETFDIKSIETLSKIQSLLKSTSLN